MKVWKLCIRVQYQIIVNPVKYSAGSSQDWCRTGAIQCSTVQDHHSEGEGLAGTRDLGPFSDGKRNFKANLGSKRDF